MKKELTLIIEKHQKWLNNDMGGERAELNNANLDGVDLSYNDLSNAIMCGAGLIYADLRNTNLSDVDLSYADMCHADLRNANLSYANLSGADLIFADLRHTDMTCADLGYANLSGADLSGANLSGANLSFADLSGANLRGANLIDADLSGTKGLVKLMGVEPGNYYWKRFEEGLCNNGYQFRVGINELPPGEVFADDERVLCSYPGFHFASRSWCAVNYPERPLEALIRIPEDAQINEPWASDGKASADKIEIIKVFDVATGEDVTDKYR
jgi:hypothetical protein